MPFLPLVSAGLGALGGIGGGRAKGRAAEAEQQAQQDRLRLEAAQQQLAEARFNREAPGLRLGNAVRGDIFANVQPFQLSGEGRNLSGSGGLTPAVLSQGTRQLGQVISRQALLSQLGGAGGAGTNPSQAAREAFGPIRPGLRGIADLMNRSRLRAAAGAYGQAQQVADDRRVADPYTFNSNFQPSRLPQSSVLDKILLGAGYAEPFLSAIPPRRQLPPDEGDIY